MNINPKDHLLLDDDKEYAVVTKVIYNDETYLYLIDINNFRNIKFCLLKEEANEEVKLMLVEDQETIKALLPLILDKK